MPASAAASRALSIALGLGAVGLAVALTWRGASRRHPPKLTKVEATDAGAGLVPYDLDAALGSLGLDLDLDASAAPRAHRDGGAGFTMSDGRPPPPLPLDAPRAVRFGVVLVTYAGAEDAPRGARSKKDALELAAKLEATARTDFHAAVRRGDDGSSDDVGAMQTGVLEPATEYVLFTLPVGGVSNPVDTPRGYSIIKRIE